MYIDTHVHCRDEDQKSKETILHSLKVAEKAGVDAIFDIVNSNNPILTKTRAEERIAIADSCGSRVFYGVWMGITKDSHQIKEAVDAWKYLFPRVVGIKMFAGESVGTLAIIKKKDQSFIYKNLAKNNYTGVFMVHSEKDSLMKPKLWDSTNPISHCWARPPEAEVESVKDQIELAWDVEFKGKLHFAHLSVPEAVEYIYTAKRNLLSGGVSNMNLTCESTYNHLAFYDEMMNIPDGLLLKFNPPLRSRDSQKGLLKCLKEGKINCIATDHAPHTRKEKMNRPYMSGIPSLHLWPRIYDFLKNHNFSEDQISNLTFNNAVKIFGLENYIKQTKNKGIFDNKEYSELRPQNVI